MKEDQEVKWCVSWEVGLSLKQWGKIYQCFVRPVLLYSFVVRLHGVECRMIRMMCRVRLVDRVLTEVLCDRVGVVKIEEMIIQSCPRWYGHVIRGDIIFQICEFMEDEITGKRKKGRPR